ncbi:MAG: major capsid protein [Duncaniella sp.]|nr:major capsid protein [Duncaniella sp.]
MADMHKPLFDIDQSGMEVEVNSYKPGNGLAWPTLFPLKFSPKFDIKGLEGDEGIPVAAERVAFNAKAPKKTRKTVGSWNGRLGKYAVSREKEEIEINEYNDLRTLAAANTEDKATARYLVDLIYDDLTFVRDAMDYKMEIDCMRIGSSGVHDFPAKIDGDMATADTINFNVPKENFVGVTTAWSDSENADGLKDIQAQQKRIADKGGKKPMFAIMEKVKYEQLEAQKKTARRLFPAISDVNLITADQITLEGINKYMRKKGWPQILVIDTYATIENKKGDKVTIKPWNENVVTLAPIAQLGWTYYKPVPVVQDTAALQSQATYYKITRYSELNPMLEVTMAEAYAQPGLINRASLVFINTANTKWANGAEA